MRVVALPLLVLALFSTAAVAQTSIDLIEFGVGNAFRPGSPVGIRLRITSDLDEAVPGIIQWEIENGDGDIAEYARAIPIQARGGQTTLWLYGVLPQSNDPTQLLDTDWGFRLFETSDGERVRVIATTRLSPRSSANAPQPVAVTQDQMLVIGPNAAGLRGYGVIPGFKGNPTLNSPSHISWGVRVANLPDSWEGLSPFSTIVWAGANDQAFSPGELDGRPAVEEALRTWVKRGGHLIVLLPGSGDPWRLGLDESALGDIFAGLKAIRHPAVPLAALLPALSVDDGLNNPVKTIAVHAFDPDELPMAWRPLTAIRLKQRDITRSTTSDRSADEILRERIDDAATRTPDQTLLWGIRRAVGFGAIDVLGIDVANPDLQVQQSPRLPQTGVFWRPILGRRATAPSGGVITALKDTKRLVTANIATNNLGTGTLVSSQIGLGGAAAQGLLAAMGLFAVYWLVAGPGGYAILRNFKLQRHAWLVFVATAAGFAVLAWLGSRMLRQDDRGIRHLTVLSHLYDPADTSATTPQFDLALTWFSAPLPGYGMVEVGIGDSEGPTGNLLNHFSPPPSGSRDKFPDSDHYTVPFNSRARYAVPARSTSAEFSGHFYGVPASTGDQWSATIRVGDTNPISIVRDPVAGTIRLQGTLINASGVTFDRVHIIQIHPLRTPAPRALEREPGLPIVTDELPNYGVFVDLGSAWSPNQVLDLGTILYPNGPVSERSRGTNALGAAIQRSYVDPYAKAQGWGAMSEVGSMGMDDQLRYLSMLGLFGALPPPIWHIPKEGQQPETVRFHRMLGWGIDQTRRFGEACLLVVAFADNVPCPLPITVDGERPPSSGRVMLQWIHPLHSASMKEDIDALAAGAVWQERATTAGG